MFLLGPYVCNICSIEWFRNTRNWRQQYLKLCANHRHDKEDGFNNYVKHDYTITVRFSTYKFTYIQSQFHAS